MAIGVPIKRTMTPQIIEPSKNNVIAHHIIAKPAIAGTANPQC
jgi:hypothetical protein